MVASVFFIHKKNVKVPVYGKTCETDGNPEN